MNHREHIERPIESYDPDCVIFTTEWKTFTTQCSVQTSKTTKLKSRRRSNGQLLHIRIKVLTSFPMDGCPYYILYNQIQRIEDTCLLNANESPASANKQHTIVTHKPKDITEGCYRASSKDWSSSWSGESRGPRRVCDGSPWAR